MDQKILGEVKKFAELVKNLVNAKMIILYGSYAKGTEYDFSDIDIAIVVDKFKGNIIDFEFELYKLRRDIDERIEPILLNINNDKSGFLDNILKDGVIIYKA